MGGYNCCVPGCTADTRKLTNLGKYPWMKNVTFHNFPTEKKNPNLRRQWIKMIGRADTDDATKPFVPTRSHRVCSRHFVGGLGPVKEHPIPTLFPRNNFKQTSPRVSAQSVSRKRKREETNENMDPNVRPNARVQLQIDVQQIVPEYEMSKCHNGVVGEVEIKQETTIIKNISSSCELI